MGGFISRGETFALRLGSVVGSVIQTTGRLEIEDMLNTVVQLVLKSGLQCDRNTLYVKNGRTFEHTPWNNIGLGT